MSTPDEAREFLMDTILAETYQGYRSNPNPTLPFDGSPGDAFDAASLARRTQGVIEAVEEGAVTVWRGAALLISWATAAAHRRFCIAKSLVPTSTVKHGCVREVRLAMYLLHYYTAKFKYWMADWAPDCLMSPLDTEASADLQGLTDALEAELKQSIFPDWKARELLPLDPRYPIIQIASAITHVDEDTFDAVRRVAVGLQRTLEQRDFIVEVPSDYVHESRRQWVECQEFKTRGGLYQASALIVFADGGGVGTATTWAIAEECGIPALLLHRPGVDLGAARFGALKTREVAEYTDEASAHDAVLRFLASKERGIRARAQWLAMLRDQVNLSELETRFRRIDPLAFEVSTISYEMAMFMLADPVRWGQARPFVTEEVSRVLGIDPEPSFMPKSGQLDSTGLIKAFVGLQNVAEVHGLTAQQQADAWQALLTDVAAKGVSHRDTTEWNFDQWVGFLRRAGWSLP